MDKEQFGHNPSLVDSIEFGERNEPVTGKRPKDAFYAKPGQTPRGLGAGLGLSVMSSLLAACGSGGSTPAPSPTNNAPPAGAPPSAPPGTPPAPGPVAPPTLKQASRFLSQTTPGASKEEITRTQQLGLGAWLEEQFVAPADTSHWDWLVAKGFNVLANKNNSQGIDESH
jgi:hypothetical protein